jgi:GntR family transcriptional regulator
MQLSSHLTHKYEQLADLLLNLIEQGSYPAGTRLPSESDLSERFAVSRPTVRRAIDILADKGLVHTEAKRGTVVLPAPTGEREPLTRYAAARARRQGLLEAGYDHRLFHVGEIPAPPHVAGFFNLQPGAPLFERSRVLHRKDNGHPHELSRSFLRVEVARGSALERPEILPKALFKTVEDLTGDTYTTATDYTDAIAADDEQARRLNVPVGTPLLRTLHVARGEQGDVLEVVDQAWVSGTHRRRDEYRL